MNNHNIEEIRKQLMATTARAKYPPGKMLGSGSTLLNLACSGHWQGGWLPGSYVFIVGDSQSGKTFFALTCFAEACQNKAFDKYQLIYNGTEHGAKMDFTQFFGKQMAARVALRNSQTIEEFYDDLDETCADDRPFLYVQDSMDGLTSAYEIEKAAEGRTARVKGRKPKGDYGDGKAKINSRNLRRIMGHLAATGSILIIINQTRDNIDAGLFDAKKTRAGGHALKFYADIEIWTSVSTAIKRTYKEKDVKIGGLIRANVKKNRLNGRERSVLVPIYYDHGFDDVGGCIDWLVEWKHWQRNKAGTIRAVEFGVELSREKLVAHVEEDALQNELSTLVATVWHAIEGAVSVKREKRYE